MSLVRVRLLFKDKNPMKKKIIIPIIEECCNTYQWRTLSLMIAVNFTFTAELGRGERAFLRHTCLLVNFPKSDYEIHYIKLHRFGTIFSASRNVNKSIFSSHSASRNVNKSIFSSQYIRRRHRASLLSTSASWTTKESPKLSTSASIRRYIKQVSDLPSYRHSTPHGLRRATASDQ